MDFVINSYKRLMSAADPRIEGWLFFDTPGILLALTVAYVYFVTRAGPRFMENRKPYNIKPLIRSFNLANVVLSAYFCYQFARNSYFGGGYNLFCQPLDFESEQSNRLLHLLWWYTLVRIADFLDTTFFVFTKKFSHVSVLHVSHHVIVVWDMWVSGKFGFSGQNAFPAIINPFVHIIMYTYYFLASFGPEVRKHLWWKKYLTQIQLIQFVIGGTHQMLPIFIDCGFPKAFSIIAVLNATYFFWMFRRFYAQNYNQRGVVNVNKNGGDKVKNGHIN